MKRIFSSVIFLVIFCHTAFSQTFYECGTETEGFEETTKSSSACTAWQNFIPD